MKKTLNLGVIGIDHGHIFDMLDEMIKEGCSCNCFWTEGDPLTLQKFNKKYPNIVERKDPTRTPIFTPSKYCVSSMKAKFPTNKLIVKPIPVKIDTA